MVRMDQPKKRGHGPPHFRKLKAQFCDTCPKWLRVKKWHPSWGILGNEAKARTCSFLVVIFVHPFPHGRCRTPTADPRNSAEAPLHADPCRCKALREAWPEFAQSCPGKSSLHTGSSKQLHKSSSLHLKPLFHALWEAYGVLPACCWLLLPHYAAFRSMRNLALG